MTNPTHTYASPYLQLQASADESTVVAAMPSGREKTLITTETDPVTGVVKELISGIEYPLFKQSDSGVDYIAYGLTLPTSGTIGVASIAAGVAYINGFRIPHAGSVLSLVASSDNYIDIDDSGNIVVSAVSPAAAAPAKAVNSLRIGYVTTNTTSVTGATKGAKDSNGVWMGNIHHNTYARSLIGGAFMSGTGNQLVAFAAGTTKYDNRNIHSETVNTSRFVADRTGIYRVTGTIILTSYAGASLQFTAAIWKNGASAALGTMAVDGQYTKTCQCGGEIDLVAGDYIELVTNFGTSTSIGGAVMNMVRL